MHKSCPRLDFNGGPLLHVIPVSLLMFSVNKKAKTMKKSSWAKAFLVCLHQSKKEKRVYIFTHGHMLNVKIVIYRYVSLNIYEYKCN